MTGPMTADEAARAGQLLGVAADLMRRSRAELSSGVAEALAIRGSVCLIYDFDEPRRELVMTAVAGGGARAAPTLRVPLGYGVAGWVASHRELAVVRDRATDRRGDHLSGFDLPVDGVAVPILSLHRYVGGVIELYGAHPSPATESGLQLLRRLASILGARYDAEFVDNRPRVSRDQFARSVIAAQEAERKRLAADIHDGISQRLVGLNFHLSAARDALGQDEAFAAEQLRCARALADLAGAEARAAIRGLRPPMLDDLGLADSLASLVRTCPGLVVSTDIDAGYVLPEHIQTALYRIAQEALQNVVKHAKAERVTVRLFATPDAIVLRVRDDGQGFDPAAVLASPGAGLGLLGMRERAEVLGGRLTVTSRLGGGTTVEVAVPPPAAAAGPG